MEKLVDPIHREKIHSKCDISESESRCVWDCNPNGRSKEFETAIIDVLAKGMELWVSCKMEEFLETTAVDPSNIHPLSLFNEEPDFPNTEDVIVVAIVD